MQAIEAHESQVEGMLNAFGEDFFLESFKEFPPRQKPATFSIDQAVEKLNQLVAAD